MKDLEHIFSFSREESFADLSENEKKDLLANCSLIFCNPALKQICDILYTRELLETMSNSKDYESIAEGRGHVFGIADVFATIHGFHLQYLDSIKQEEIYNKQEII